MSSYKMTSIIQLCRIILFFISTIDSVYSCAATQSSSTPTTTTTRVTTTTTATTTTTTVNPCATCSQINVLMTTPALDQPVTQTIGTNANGCTTDTITCNNPNAAGQVIFQFFNNGVDMGTDSGTGTVTDTLVCNAQGQLVLTLNGASSVVTDVECLAA